MIARKWHGRDLSAKAPAYREFVTGRAVPDYRSVRGNLGVHIFERTDGDITHFVAPTSWENLDAVRDFAGRDVDRAKYYPEDKDFLLEFVARVMDYEVVGMEP